jgi:antitoxin component HigA of HigAB toxin-antitoxin module
MSVDTVVDAIEQEIAKAEETAEEVTQYEISDVEKLFITRTENSFLKTQVELQQLQSRISQLNETANSDRKLFLDKLNELVKKYSIDETKFVFDNIELVFKKKK